MHVRLISSEGYHFDVDSEDCKDARYITSILDMSCVEELPVLEFPTINGQILRVVVEFMQDYQIAISKPFADREPRGWPAVNTRRLLHRFHKSNSILVSWKM